MTHHHLKIWPAHLFSVASGARKHELRRNDRDYAVGDTLTLSEWDPASGRYTGRGIDVRVTHVLAIGKLATDFKNVLGLNPCLPPLNELVILSIEHLYLDIPDFVRQPQRKLPLDDDGDHF